MTPQTMKKWLVFISTNQLELRVSAWQRPEISSIILPRIILSLNDPIDPTLLPQQKDKRSKRWKDAHSKKGKGEGEKD